MERISIEDQIACVEREIRMRENTYPRWVAQNKLTQKTATLELDRMKAVLATLGYVKSERHARATGVRLG